MASSSNPNSMDKFTHAEHFHMEPPACFTCDEGGDLVFCDGLCGKHFHYTQSSTDGSPLSAPETIESSDGDGPPSFCKPQILPPGHNHDMEWKCDRCIVGETLCFACGMVGRVKDSHPLRQRLVQCAHPDCYSFYHLSCIRVHCKLRQLPISKVYGCKNKEKDALFCPRHYCDHCKVYLPEICEKIQCWKCPKSWCINTRKHCFELGVHDRDIWDFEGWQMVYCNDHKIIDGLYVPEIEGFH